MKPELTQDELNEIVTDPSLYQQMMEGMMMGRTQNIHDDVKNKFSDIEEKFKDI